MLRAYASAAAYRVSPHGHTLQALKLLGLVLACALGSGHAQGLTLSGMVIDDSGLPVAGSLIRYRLVTPPRANLPAIQNPVLRSDSSGRFSLPGLLAGDYYVCPEGTGVSHLNPCDWEPMLPVTLTSASAQLIHQFTIHSGTQMLVTITFLNQPLRRSAPITMFATNSHGRFAEARLISNNGTEAVYSVAAPKATLITLSLTAALTILDATGQAFTSGLPWLTLQTGQANTLAVHLTAKD